MKKLLLLVGILFIFTHLRAQDTVRYGDPWYTFNPAPILHQGSVGYCFFVPENMADTYVIQAYPNNNNVIYGIALTIDTFSQFLNPGNEPRLLLVEDIEHHCVDVNGIGSFMVIDSIGKIDTLEVCQAPRRQCYFDYHFGYDFINHQPTSYESVITSNCYEFYFDNPIELKDNGSGISDTFYIGGLLSSSFTYYDTIWGEYLDALRGGFDNSHHQPWVAMHDRIPGYLARHGFNASSIICGEWPGGGEYIGAPAGGVWGVVFPIVNLRCVTPRLSFVGKDAGMATVAWRQNDTPEQYQISITPWDIAGTDPDSGAMFYTTDTSFTFTDLQPDTRYSVWVRKACRYTTSAYDTIVWSDWSNEIVFMFVDIDEVEADGVRITSQRGSIVVEGAEGREVRVYDMLGREVCGKRKVESGKSSFTVPVAGIYMVRVGDLPARKVAVLR